MCSCARSARCCSHSPSLFCTRCRSFAVPHICPALAESFSLSRDGMDGAVNAGQLSELECGCSCVAMTAHRVFAAASLCKSDMLMLSSLSTAPTMRCTRSATGSNDLAPNRCQCFSSTERLALTIGALLHRTAHVISPLVVRRPGDSSWHLCRSFPPM